MYKTEKGGCSKIVGGEMSAYGPCRDRPTGDEICDIDHNFAREGGRAPLKREGSLGWPPSLHSTTRKQLTPNNSHDLSTLESAVYNTVLGEKKCSQVHNPQARTHRLAIPFENPICFNGNVFGLDKGQIWVQVPRS